MGSDDHGYDERPVHSVTLSAFRMDRFEVTYGEYQRFLERNPSWSRRRVTTKEADLEYLSDWHEATFRADLAAHPVVNISWHAASAYCAWAGKALPTEAQWEYASRGGASGQDYPWGNELLAYLVQSRRSDSRGTERVGSYTVNGFGINDLAGNVREWTASGYQMYAKRPETDPVAGVNRHLKVIRGGSWNSDEDSLRVSAREASAPTRCAADLGFRCVGTTRP